MIRSTFVAVLVAAVACTSAGSASHPSSTPPAHSQLQAWTYEGVVRQNSIDNRVIALPDGGYRQVFSRWRSFATGPDGLAGQDAYYVTAISSDGLHWTDEGDSPIGYYVPLRLPDGTYRAFETNPAPAKLYRSTDAKNWSVAGTIVPPELHNPTCLSTSGMLSDVLALPDGTLRGYYNCLVGTFFNIKASEILSATSKDGLNWQKDPGVRINPLDGPEIPRGPDGQPSAAGDAGHPRVFRLPDGTLKMFYHSLYMCCLWSATSVDGLSWTNRKPENVFGGDADVIVLQDGRVRVFVNGNLGLPADFAGHSAAENRSRTVSYIYGPTNYRLSTSGQLPVTPGQVVSAHLSVAVEGAGPSVKLDAAAYAAIGGIELHDLLNGAYGPVTVSFKPPAGKAPFTADATFAWTVDPLEQAFILAGGVLIFADNGTTKQVVPVRYGWAAGPNCGPGTGTPCAPTNNCGPGTGTPCPPTNTCGPGTGTPCPPTNCGPGTGTPCPPTNCGPGTGTPCPPTNCGPGTGTPCIQPSQGPCTPGTACPGTPDNCGPGQQFACPSPAVACQKGQPIPSRGCVTGGYDGKPKLCLPMGVDANPPLICQEFY